MGMMLTPATLRQQPAQEVAQLNPNNRLASLLTAVFPFNRTFRSATARSGNPVVTSGPSIQMGPGGSFYSQGNGSGKVVTDLMPSQIGFSGATARSFYVDFYMGDTNSQRAVFSLGDSSTNNRTQFTFLINTDFRLVSLQTYGSDLNYSPYTTSGQGARVKLLGAYDGNVTVNFYSIAYLDNGSVVVNSQTSSLPSPLATGNTVPLNLIGGGTYGFPSMVSPLYFAAFFGGSNLSQADFNSLVDNPWQMFSAPAPFRRTALASAAASRATAPTTISANSGSVLGMGSAASVVSPSTVPASYGNNSVSGNSASVVAATIIAANPSISAPVGQSAGVTGSSSVNANPGVAVTYGAPASITSPSSVVAANSPSPTGAQSASVVAVTAIAANPSIASASGQSATTSGATTIQAAPGVSSTSGQSASVGGSTTVTASPSIAAGGGQNATVSVPVTINAAPAVVATTGQFASIVLPVSVSAAAARVVSAGLAAQISSAVTIFATPSIGSPAGQGASIVNVPSILAATSFGVTSGQPATVQTFNPLQALPSQGVSSGQPASVTGATNIAPNITEDLLCQIVRAYILSIAPALRVIRTPVNLASPPNGSYVSFTAGVRKPLSTTIGVYAGLTRNVQRHEEMMFQIDCYGNGARDLSETLSALFRDQYAIDQFAQFGQDVVPLYADDVRPMPFVNDAGQYEEHYSFDIHIQVNSTIITPQQSANMLNINILSVDATYPPV